MIKELNEKILDQVNNLLSENNYNKIDTYNEFTKRYCFLDNDKVVGYIEYSIYYERVELNYIVVDKECRHKQIATRLMEKMINESKENNCINITLEVKTTNNAAIKLYEKFNFKEVALRKNYYKDGDAFLFELKLEGD